MISKILIYLKQNLSSYYLVDQIVYSFSNFINLFLLSKFMIKYDYSLFVLFLSAILFVFGIVNSLIIIPMQINFYKKKNKKKIYTIYLLEILLLLFVCSPIIVTLFLYIYFNIFNLGVILASLFICIINSIYEFYRFYSMINEKIVKVIISDFIVNSLELLLICIFIYLKSINFLTVIVIYCISISIGVFYLFESIEFININEFNKIIVENWKLGKYRLFQHFLFFVTDPLFMFIGAFFLGTELFAVYGTLQLFGRAASIIVLSNNNYSLSIGAKLLKKNGYNALNSYISKLYLKMILPLLFYSIIIIIFGKKILEYVYGSNYSTYWFLILLFVLNYFIDYLNQPIKSVLLIIGRTDSILYSNLYASIVSLLLYYPLIHFFNIYGIIIGILISNIMIYLLNYKFLKKVIPNST